MNWLTEWRAISDRIKGLVAATTVFFRGLRVENSDGYGIKKKHLLPAARGIFASLTSLSTEHGDSLPVKARETLTRFLSQNESLLTNSEVDNIEAVMAGTTALAGFRSELQYQLTDLDASVLRLSERAFVHLQRQIVADSSYGEKWQKAFEDGEVGCERLGSVHLLQHGIWGFKVSATGERTDLVFAEPLLVSDAIARIADGLVLTEWKGVRAPDQLDEHVAKARTQAQLYALGVLGGIELRGYRYLVMVTRKRLEMPADQQLGGVTYRTVNIAVAPDVPSRS